MLRSRTESCSLGSICMYSTWCHYVLFNHIGFVWRIYKREFRTAVPNQQSSPTSDCVSLESPLAPPGTRLRIPNGGRWLGGFWRLYRAIPSYTALTGSTCAAGGRLSDLHVLFRPNFVVPDGFVRECYLGGSHGGHQRNCESLITQTQHTGYCIYMYVYVYIYVCVYIYIWLPIL